MYLGCDFNIFNHTSFLQYLKKNKPIEKITYNFKNIEIN